MASSHKGPANVANWNPVVKGAYTWLVLDSFGRREAVRDRTEGRSRALQLRRMFGPQLRGPKAQMQSAKSLTLVYKKTIRFLIYV